MSVLLDTDIVIEIQRGNDPQIRSQSASLVASGTVLLYSPVLAAETWAGVRPQEHLLVQSFFDALTCVPADYGTGKLAGDLMRKFARSPVLKSPTPSSQPLPFSTEPSCGRAIASTIPCHN